MFHHSTNKSVFIFIVFLIPFFSCEKNSTPDPSTVEGRVQYKVNGELVVIDHVNMISNQYCVFVKANVGIPVETEYHFAASNGQDPTVAMTIKTDSLQIKNYHLNYDSASPLLFYLKHKGLNASLFSSGDQVDMNITGYKDGLISGTFTATLTPTPDNPSGHEANSIKITEGKINSVAAVY